MSEREETVPTAIHDSDSVAVGNATEGGLGVKHVKKTKPRPERSGGGGIESVLASASGASGSSTAGPSPSTGTEGRIGCVPTV